ncbi:outer membrane protein [Fulvivirga lutea]|uniref:Outer membrane beta-barrel protein n=1 Tax=Fulvivirga lutea TaxID=2810512 RepID=A0A974WJC6_9BACT|nr:outer membrane beta-barrel protein [Fulvivirga lutea]QSE96408.1 outer membrane beta-barrel protein [Fulvivirga lutea]
MKKTFLLALFLTIAISSMSQRRIGGNLVYGTEIEEIGIGAVGEFFFNDNLAIAPSFNYYFAEDPVSFWELNANINYYFSESGAVSAYALGGLNLARVSVDLGPFGESSDTELGLNLGAGANFDVGDSIIPFAELRFVLSDFDQAVFAFGVKFPLN